MQRTALQSLAWFSIVIVPHSCCNCYHNHWQACSAGSVREITVCVILTPSQQKKEPPFLGELAEDHHKHEIKHDSFTEHPAKDT